MLCAKLDLLDHRWHDFVVHEFCVCIQSFWMQISRRQQGFAACDRSDISRDIFLKGSGFHLGFPKLHCYKDFPNSYVRVLVYHASQSLRTRLTSSEAFSYRERRASIELAWRSRMPYLKFKQRLEKRWKPSWGYIHVAGNGDTSTLPLAMIVALHIVHGDAGKHN